MSISWKVYRSPPTHGYRIAFKPTGIASNQSPTHGDADGQQPRALDKGAAVQRLGHQHYSHAILYMHYRVYNTTNP